MGVTKIDLFTDNQNRISVLAKALGHPARIAIIEHLLSVNECICGELVHHISLAQPTVSQHLKELKNAGFIKGTIEGNSICYCVNEEVLNEFKTYFEEMNLKLKKLKCC